MKRALCIAKIAFSLKKIPVAAVLVNKNFEIGSGFNFSASNQNSFYHAEINSFKQGMFYFSNHILRRTKLYITLEPCLTCISYAYDLGIKYIIFSAYSKTNKNTYLKNFILLKGGVLEKESKYLLKMFFKKNRQND